ncbi:hypothetical protein [Halomarina rubra]|uniref:Uncharacterized protein n=1 Tax=Halomarina rubra TaxID=2071873 RepID=A0ABD6AUS7_9EURY|nr:hypothetical protein [Halomarina rubra]
MSAKTPTLSDHITKPGHVGGRWDQRTAPDAPSPEQAFADSRSVGLLRHHPWFDQGGYPPVDVRVTDLGRSVIVFICLRYYVPEGTRDKAVTCYDARVIDDTALRWACIAIARAGGETDA